jgi:hypothetical protein
MQFQPSEFSYYGQSEVEAPPEVEGAPAPAGGGVADYLQYVPIARDFLLGADPEQEAALIEAKIENLKAQKKKLPALSGFYQNEINKLKSKLTVPGGHRRWRGHSGYRGPAGDRRGRVGLAKGAEGVRDGSCAQEPGEPQLRPLVGHHRG